MDIKKIKKLRTEISISLTLAKSLLQENDGDIERSKNMYHKNNINTICQLTECDNQCAKECYEVSHFDVKKAINRAYLPIKYLTIESIPDNSEHPRVGFVFWVKNERLDKYNKKNSRRPDLFVKTEDFDFTRSAFNAVYPFEYNGKY